MGKMAKGEPIFDENNAHRQSTDTGASQQVPTVDAIRQNGHKVIPEIRVTRLVSRRNGSNMTTHVWLQNDAPFAVEVRSFRVMGQATSMNYRLEPAQGREVNIYSGPVASHDDEDDAYVDYRIVQNGDYFQQHFHVEFDRQSDGMYLLEELHPEHVKDT
ncbi:MAG: hypothetical protein UY35_C0005G0135 [Candidatus Saccharibacteria bacterium GW2011_GWC2_48_9]|nr:MAG: hypothetical protein UY35_C0005G0135 [Candidatus Saccharibacteria bacterium GW2011_GWC2_48_9]